MLDLLRRPAGFLPPAISAGFLIAMAAGIAQGTLVPRADEGTQAHLFQLLVPLQLVIMAWFAVSWLPRRPAPAGGVLAVQGALLLAVLSIVYFRHL